jgi:hypothetical protein
LSSLFDVPAQLALLLSLAAAGTGPTAPNAPGLAPTTFSAHTIREPILLIGPYRFGEEMWLRALKEGPADDESRAMAGAVFRTSGGRYYVPASGERERILAKRASEELAARVARAFAEINRERMRTALQRPPTGGELYIAHVLGPETAVALIDGAKAAPDQIAAERLPELAAAAPEVAMADGRRRTLAEVYDRFIEPFAGWAQRVASMVPRGLRFKPTLPEASSGEAAVVVMETGGARAKPGARPLQ